MDVVRHWWPLLLLGIASLYLAAMAVALTPVRVMHEYVITTVEPQAVAGALRVANGELLYQDFRGTLPIVPLSYGALTYAVPGGIARMLGHSDAQAVLYAGRLVSLLSALVLPVLLLLACRQRQVEWRWAWLSLLPLIWFPRLAENWSKFLPHHPALTLSILGWVLLSARPSASRVVNLLRSSCAVLSWTAGFLLHPTVVIGPLVFAAESLLGRERSGSVKRGLLRRDILAPLIAYPLCSIATAWILNVRTDGLWFLNTVEAMKVCRYDASYTISDLAQLRAPGVLFLGAMVLASALLWRQTPLFAAYACALMLELALMTKQGSTASYLAGSMALWGIAFAVAWSRSVPRAETGERLPGRGALVFVTLALAVGAFWTIPYASTPNWEIPVPDGREGDQVDRAIGQMETRSPLFLDAFYAQQRGFIYPYADPYHAALLQEHGLVNLQALEKGLRSRQYDLVVANLLHLGPSQYHGAPMVIPGIRSALQENYTVVAVGRWLALLRLKEQAGAAVSQASPR